MSNHNLSGRVSSSSTPPGGGLALASRGDDLTPFLFEALERRYRIAGTIDAELTFLQRYLVAAITFRPNRSKWVERFYKSATATRLRSWNAERQLRRFPRPPDVALQVHALFRVEGTPSVLYVDCTHAQSAQFWPAWNPLHGRALTEWYRREGLAYENAAHIFTFSEATKASVVNDFGIESEKVTVTGAGINFSHLPQSLPATAPSESGDPTVLFIGNDFVRKGGKVLLEAFTDVRKVIPNAKLQLVGLDPQIESQEGVEVLGLIRDRERIADLYRTASVFVMPSFFDPWALVALEAMAYGVPVIASNRMGVSEMIEDGVSGRIVEAGDVGSLTAAILSLLRDRDLAARIAAVARKNVETNFTWDAVVDRMSPALQSLMARAEA